MQCHVASHAKMHELDEEGGRGMGSSGDKDKIAARVVRTKLSTADAAYSCLVSSSLWQTLSSLSATSRFTHVRIPTFERASVITLNVEFGTE